MVGKALRSWNQVRANNSSARVAILVAEDVCLTSSAMMLFAVLPPAMNFSLSAMNLTCVRQVVPFGNFDSAGSSGGSGGSGGGSSLTSTFLFLVESGAMVSVCAFAMCVGYGSVAMC